MATANTKWDSPVTTEALPQHMLILFQLKPKALKKIFAFQFKYFVKKATLNMDLVHWLKIVFPFHAILFFYE